MIRFRFLFYAAAMLLLITSTLVGCNIIPEEYTEGVKLDRSYPEDDMPIYDDALVYYCKDDDEGVTIKFGTQDGLDDVTDFYKDYFEDSGIVPDEKDRSTRYAAEGTYKDFQFEIRITKSSGEYEEQVFETVVKIEIEFLDIDTTQPKGAVSDEDIIGFWREENMDDGVDLDTVDTGSALLFFEDGTLEIYANYNYARTSKWEVSEDKNALIITDHDGSATTVPVRLEQHDSKTYLIWGDAEERAFYKSKTDGFTLYDPNIPDEDKQLKDALADKTWYYVHYSDAEGEIYTGSTGYSIYHSDGTFEDSYNEDTDSGTWYIDNNRIYCTYNDGIINSWAIEIIYDNGINNLYFYTDNTSEFWLYSDVVQQTTNTSPIADKLWYIYAYINNDGTKQVYSASETMMFSSDSSFEYYHTDGSIVSGTWELKDNELYIHYTDGSTLSWVAEHEYLFGVNTLYLTDSSGGDWVYTDISLINGPIILPTDERVTNALVGSNFYSMHYLYPDGFQEEMTVTTLIYYEDGTFYEDFGGDILTGTWYFKNGILHMEYPSLGEIHDYPDSYLEYDRESNSLTLHMGDDQEGFEGGYWLFTTYES